MCAHGGLPCVADRDLASCPRPCGLDCTPRSIVGAALLEKWQNVFRTIRSPSGKETVLGDIKRPTAMDCNKMPVSHMWPSAERHISAAAAALRDSELRKTSIAAAVCWSDL
jgi:hypothetical protein